MKNITLSCALIASLSLGQIAFANEDPFALKVLKDGDLQLTCEELVDEATLMRDIMQTTEEVKNDAELNGHAVTAAGAIGSFLIGSVTGGIGLAAAGFLVSQEVEESAKSADNTQDIASQRRALMAGIHKAKKCEHPIENAMTDINSKSALDIGAERLAALEPASGDDNKPRLND